MRRYLLTLALCACGSSPPLSSTFDAGPLPPATKLPFDASPGPDDELDAALSVGPTCAPGTVRVIASTALLDGPRLDDAWVYWTVGEPGGDSSQGYWWNDVEAIHRADKLGASSTRLFSTDSFVSRPSSTEFAIDAAHAYWVDNHEGYAFGDVVRGDKDGSNATALVAGIEVPHDLKLAGETLFFVSGTSLLSIDVDGTNERPITENWTPSEWVVGAASIDAIVNGEPVRIARTGGASEPLLLSPAAGVKYEGLSIGADGYVYAVALDDKDHFISSGSVVRIPTDRGTPTPVGSPFTTNAPDTISFYTAVDGNCVYFTTTEGVFQQCEGGARAIGAGPASAPPVIDSTSVYWAAEAPDGTATIYAWCKD